ncbi:MAG: hypothetical protein QM654_15295 [Dysgonamonadaceae bacterium]
MKKLIYLVCVLSSCSVFVACNDDDNTHPFELSKTTTKLLVGKSDTIRMSNGTAPYTVQSPKMEIVNYSVKGDTLFLKGVSEGSIQLNISDANSQKASISAQVYNESEEN